MVSAFTQLGYLSSNFNKYHYYIKIIIFKVSIASNLNFAIYMIWGLKANLSNAGTIALIIILCSIILYFILENFIWRHYLIYNFSPWIVIVVALSGN
jgi:hypothetical protein